VKGHDPTYYRRKPKETDAWPPRFMKFILHLKGAGDKPSAQLAFLDPRRLGRIRLCKSPLTEPPISALGFDPLLSMPSLDDFIHSVKKRTCPIKALLLDQSFSAGVGNWVADEILYQSRVHPEQRANTLNQPQMEALYAKTVEICRNAVEVNADSALFPSHWLFKHRWGKGKKSKHAMLLPDGQPATIKWIQVGGRTSAYVSELQVLPSKLAASTDQTNLVSEGELTSLSDTEEEKSPQQTPSKRKRKIVSQDRTPSETPKRVRTFTLKDSHVVEGEPLKPATPLMRRSQRNTAGLRKG